MSTKPKELSDPLELYVSDDSMGIKIGIDENNLIVKEVELKKKYFVRHVKQVRTIKETADAISIYCPDEKENQFQQNYMQAFYKIYGRLIRSANLSISDLHYLPASRSGLYQALGAFSQIVAELAKSRTLLSSRLVLPSIAIPLSDYFLKLSNLRPPPKTETSSVFASIAQSIEQSILRGKVDFDQKTKRLLFEPDGLQLSLDLSATSSMVSEISPIAAYFKYVLPRSDLMSGRGKSSDHKTKQIVIIEEPEAHLHPQLQAALVEVFAAMARTAGVKIIMTSHSNYVFNKASNLLIDESINAASFRAIVFKRQPTGGEGIDLICSDLGIEDDNFIDIGEELYEERIRLLKNKEDKKGVPHNSAT